MGILSNWFFPEEFKTTVPVNTGSIVDVPVRTGEEIEDQLRGENIGCDPRALSVVFACARVIAEGLALPPLYLNRTDKNGRTLATDLPLFRLLNAAPSNIQTSYEMREQIGHHLALDGNAYVWLNRSQRTGEILEMLPMDPGAVTRIPSLKLGAPNRYYLYGQEIPSNQMWHIRGPAWFNTQGLSILHAARKALQLTNFTETYGTNLYKNGTQVSGLVSIKSETVSQEQIDKIRTNWNARNSGLNNSGGTAFIPGDLAYTPMAGSATDAQWIEARRFQIEEICRFFRVSPTKVFQSLGSQSYASVEQAHIAHDQDTDAHWHERFVQSANKNVLTEAERKAGLVISLDNRAALRGTAVERMSYYQLGIANGIFTRNEVREMEGFDRSNDPQADELTPAANLFGPKGPSAASSE